MKKDKKNQAKSAQKHVTILGIGVISTSTSSVLAFVREKLDKREKFYIVTPNSEIIMLAQKDRQLAEILNNADLSIADGVGLSYASWFLGNGWLNVIPGREVFVNLLEFANENGLKVFLLGGTVRSIEKSTTIINSKYPDIVVDGEYGPSLDENAKALGENEREILKKTIDKINKFAPDLLFVGFGAPKQEKFVSGWMSELNIGGAMVVGGALDYFAGVAKLPPKWMASLGLEWLWRLVRQPSRIKRIITAIVIFPLKVFFSKFSPKAP